jgi:hypothetical protein
MQKKNCLLSRIDSARTDSQPGTISKGEYMDNNETLEEILVQIKSAEIARGEAFKYKPVKIICKPVDLDLINRILNVSN